MPLYDYHCGRCGKTFELLRSLQDADLDLKCPYCQSEQVERQLSSFSTSTCSSGSSRFR